MLAKHGAIATYAGKKGADALTLDKIQGPYLWKFVRSGPDETSAHQ
jgi:hypothetical protein